MLYLNVVKTLWFGLVELFFNFKTITFLFNKFNAFLLNKIITIIIIKLYVFRLCYYLCFIFQREIHFWRYLVERVWKMKGLMALLGICISINFQCVNSSVWNTSNGRLYYIHYKLGFNDKVFDALTYYTACIYRIRYN